MLKQDPRLGDIDPYEVEYGVMLRNDLHKAYDRYLWSFYVRPVSFPVRHQARQTGQGRPADRACAILKKKQDRALVVHVFSVKFLQTAAAFHGKVIPYSSFDNMVNLPGPNLDMVRWHYRQAVQMHLRSFAWGLPASRLGKPAKGPTSASSSKGSRKRKQRPAFDDDDDYEP